MDKGQFDNLINEIKDYSLYIARENGWEWYYYVHQREVVRCAERLLKEHKADRHTLLIAAWLHDISKYAVPAREFSHKLQAKHHIDSAKIAEKFLTDFGVNKKETAAIRQCILRHRNKGNYKARNIPEKILVVADAMSHFTGVFYFLHHKFHYQDSVDEMVEKHLKKLKEDWRDLGLLAGAREMVRPQYEVLLELHKNHKQTKK
jgi:HD superfamily phosphohydrolase YqeK